MIVDYTKLSNKREKVGTSFQIINETFRLFLGVLLLTTFTTLNASWDDPQYFCSKKAWFNALQ